jgi:hypothetical protein
VRGTHSLLNAEGGQVRIPREREGGTHRLSSEEEDKLGHQEEEEE